MPTPKAGEYWGILGGTFDPVHLGHVTLARDICRIKRLTGVLLVPTINHPLKKDGAFARFDDRMSMLRLAVEGQTELLVDAIESQQNLSGYTLDTVKAVKAKYPGVSFSFLVGADNIEQISDWHQPEKIFKEVAVIAGTRPGFKPNPTDDTLLSLIEYVETSSIDVSSSEIRDAISSGECHGKLGEWLHPAVTEYILINGLYQ